MTGFDSVSRAALDPKVKLIYEEYGAAKRNSSIYFTPVRQRSQH